MSTTIFTVKRSEIEGRLDPIYYIRKNELVGYKHLKLEKIGKHFFVKDGDHDKLPDDAVSDENNGFRYLRAQDLKENKIISEKPIYVTKKYFESVRRCHIYPNDLLFSIMASVGATAVVPKNFSICTANRAVGILRAKDEAVFLPEYVQVVLNTELGIKLLELQKRGGIQQRVNLDDISNLELPVFDFEKQREIIDFYNSSLSKKQHNQEQAKELLASIDSYLLSELGITLPQKDNSLSKRIFTTKFSEVTGGRLDPLYQFNSSFLISTKYEQVKLAEICNSFISGFGAGKENQTSEINGIIQIRPTNIDSECELKFDKNKDDALAVVSVILNRCDSSKWRSWSGITPYDQVIRAGQFEVYASGAYKSYMPGGSRYGSDKYNIAKQAVIDGLNGIRNNKYLGFRAWHVSGYSDKYIVEGGNRYA